jgi:CheY-like chemotaxis protein
MTLELQCLLLTCDSALLQMVTTALQSVSVGLEIRTDSSSAREMAERRHLDGFILDCDDVAGGHELLAQIRRGKCNRAATVVALSNGASSAALLDLGANFVIAKPVTLERLESHLAIALPLMIREHRRYFRFSYPVPIEIEFNRQRLSARMVNISEGGLALRTSSQIQGKIRLAFELPSTVPCRIELKGEVVWNDREGLAGIRFLHMPESSREQLQQWLFTLESQMMLREGGPRPSRERSTG